MQKAVTGARVLLGLAMAVFGLNGFFNFIPPLELGPEAERFLTAIMESGYLWQFLKIVELVGGLMLIANVMVPFALIILAPGLFNVVLFHLFLDPANLPPGLVLVALGFFLAWAYRDSWKAVFQISAEPTAIRRAARSEDGGDQSGEDPLRPVP